MSRRAVTAMVLVLACAACGTGGPTGAARPAAPTGAARDDLPQETLCDDTDGGPLCMPLAEALRWWGLKPALVPADATGSRALLRRGYDAGTSEEPGYEPHFAFVVPDRLFPTMTRLRVGDGEAARAGGVVVRATYAVDHALPRPERGSRTVRVRGHAAILTERPVSGGGPALREVTWWVPYLDDNVVWHVTDSTGARSERELVALLDTLVERRDGA